MKNFRLGFLSVPMLLSLAIVAGAMLLGAPFAFDGDTFTVLGVGMAAAAVEDVARPWRRVSKPINSFENVVASGLAILDIPRYAYTLYGVTLQMGGTTFNESYITSIRLRLGSKTIWLATGADLRKINRYKVYYDGNRQFLYVDFSQKHEKNFGGEFIGGIDMASLPAGPLKLEVTTSGATAPTLAAVGKWGPPQSNDVMQKLLQFPYTSGSGTGRRTIPFDFRGAKIRRLFFLYAGTDWVTTAAATAFTGNTGNGTMGAITVAADTKVGTWKLVVTLAAANAGVFQVYDPDGVPESKRGNVASAYAGPGGLSFTLADGATDFAAGDGFDIVVSENTDGNLARVEVIKNGESVWDYTCTQARNLQKQYGYVPQTKMYVVDFEADRWPDGALPTADVVTLEVAATWTAADTATIYAEILDTPNNN